MTRALTALALVCVLASCTPSPLPEPWCLVRDGNTITHRPCNKETP